MDKKKFISLMVPDITEEDISAASEVLRSGMLVQGENVQKLEEEIARYLGIKNAVAVSSGTASLHIALLALGIGPGDEVIVPAFSFMATANVVEVVGAKPVFVDIDIRTFNIDTKLVEEAITPKTKAIMPVHEFGLACDIGEICRIARNQGLLVIEDAACALGATENGRYAGTFGDAGSFSFHPRKAITSGEGGMLVTDNDELAQKFRALRNHGISNKNGKMEFVVAGLNYRMTDFQAALLYSQFQRFEAGIKTKRHLATQYLSGLDKTDWIKLPVVPENKEHSWQSFQVLVDANRDGYIDYLKLNGIGSNLGSHCIPCQEYYKKKYGLQCRVLFPNALFAYQYGLAIPLYPKLTTTDIAYITDLLCNLL